MDKNEWMTRFTAAMINHCKDPILAAAEADATWSVVDDYPEWRDDPEQAADDEFSAMIASI